MSHWEVLNMVKSTHAASTPQITDAAPLALDAEPVANGALPPHLAGRLATERIHSLSQWACLSRRRKRLIFGITAAHVRLLDQLARGAM
jgi:hypothetical protein